MIHYISPYSTSKNIGGAINDAIKQLQPADDDWICHIDQDAMFLRPDSKRQLEEILVTTDFDILGAVTNRVGLQIQLVNGLFDVTDMWVHLEVAEKLHNENYGVVVSVNEPLAAFCLCFRVSVWKKLGSFRENCLQFDWYFTENARKMGVKLGLCTGIYVFHLYRMSRNVKDITHLL
jgi:glycosyltransferase involved in cell wall biosynthesis